MVLEGRIPPWVSCFCYAMRWPYTRKSWSPTKMAMIVLSVPIAVLCISVFRVNLNVQRIPVLERIIGVDEPIVPLNKTTKTILFWTSLFGDRNFYFGQKDIFRDCPVSDCYATHQRSSVNVERFDAILFHGNELERGDLPNNRDPGQWYIYVNLESPESRPLEDTFYADYFNLTMTYRLNSDVPRTYAVVRKRKNDEVVAPFENTTWDELRRAASGEGTGEEEEEDGAEEPALTENAKAKNRPIAWFVSNCNAKSGRSEYAEELSRYLDVDVYGKCGDYRCPRTRDCLRDVVEPRYFFYLSFENSLCEDYVTEKLYNPLRYNVVPIVYGGANYSKFAPPHSYVNALDFDTPRELAAYLKRVMADSEQYRRFFRWKKYYRIEDGSKRAICELCGFLHRKHRPRTNSESVLEWYTRDKCPIQRVLINERYVTRRGLNELAARAPGP